MAADSAIGAVNGGATYAERHNIADHFIGGNRLANAPASKVKDFVAEHDGHTVITNVSRAFQAPFFPPLQLAGNLETLCTLTRFVF